MLKTSVIKGLSCFFLMQLATAVACGQTSHLRQPPDQSIQARVQVQNFYRQVIVHERTGIPSATELRIYAPYLSRAMRRKIQDGSACAKDWHEPVGSIPLKSPFSWEAGFFSSSDDEEPYRRTFKIEKTQLQQDGSFLVYLKFTQRFLPPNTPITDTWDIKTRVISEAGRFVIDDIFLRDDKDSLTQAFPQLGCQGPRWGESSH